MAGYPAPVPYIDQSNLAPFEGQQFIQPNYSQFAFQPYTCTVPWPVVLGGIAPANFFAPTYQSPAGGDTSHVAVGTINGMVTTGGSITSPAHTVGELGWNVGNINAGATQTLIVGQESKLDLIGTGTYTLAYSNLSNINTVAAGVTMNGVLANYVAQNAGLSASVPKYASLTTSFSGLAAGYTVTVWSVVDMEPPSGIAGTIANFWGVYMPAWTGINIPGQFYAINIQESRAAINTKGQIFAASGGEVSPSAFLGSKAGQYQFGVGWSPALTTLALGASLAYYGVFWNPARQTFSKSGLEVTTGVAGKNIQWAIFAAVAGAPSGPPLFVSQNHSAAAAAVIEETGLSLTLEAGTYLIAVVSDGTGVTVRAVTDSDAAKAVGTYASNTALDSMPYSAIVLNAGSPTTTFPATPPAIAGYAAAGSIYPQTWLRV